MHYWYRAGEEIDGPFPLDEVLEKHRGGEIPADAEVAEAQGDPRWKPLRAILPASELKLVSLQAADQLNLKANLGIAGSLTLILGVFSPLISAPVMGTFNYFQNGKGDGVIVVILAVWSLVLSVRRKYRGLWFTGLASAGLLVFTFTNFQMRMEKLKSDMKTQLAGNPFAGLANLTLENVQMQWGWAVLIVGTLLILAAAGSKQQTRFERLRLKRVAASPSFATVRFREGSPAASLILTSGAAIFPVPSQRPRPKNALRGKPRGKALRKESIPGNSGLDQRQVRAENVAQIERRTSARDDSTPYSGALPALPATWAIGSPPTSESGTFPDGTESDSMV